MLLQGIFYLGEEIGRGAYARVVAASVDDPCYPRLHSRRLAIKMPAICAAQQYGSRAPQHRQRCEASLAKEVQILERVHHPNIVKGLAAVYESGRAAGLVMPMAPCGTLDDWCWCVPFPFFQMSTCCSTIQGLSGVKNITIKHSTICSSFNSCDWSQQRSLGLLCGGV